jgi:hypothetical protein
VDRVATVELELLLDEDDKPIYDEKGALIYFPASLLVDQVDMATAPEPFHIGIDELSGDAAPTEAAPTGGGQLTQDAAPIEAASTGGGPLTQDAAPTEAASTGGGQLTQDAAPTEAVSTGRVEVIDLTAEEVVDLTNDDDDDDEEEDDEMSISS